MLMLLVICKVVKSVKNYIYMSHDIKIRSKAQTIFIDTDHFKDSISIYHPIIIRSAASILIYFITSHHWLQSIHKQRPNEGHTTTATVHWYFGEKLKSGLINTCGPNPTLWTKVSLAGSSTTQHNTTVQRYCNKSAYILCPFTHCMPLCYYVSLTKQTTCCYHRSLVLLLQSHRASVALCCFKTHSFQ